MSYIKKFENFNQDFDNNNGKIWITGIPSGESFNLDIDIFDDIYKTGVIRYNTEYVSTGFFAFDDINTEKIKRMIAWSKNSEENREYEISDHNFKDFNKLLNAVNNIKSHVNIIAKGNVMMFISGIYKIYLIITDTGLYELKVMKNGKKIDQYVIPVASTAPSRIKEESTKYFDNENSNPKSINEEITFKIARQKVGGHLFIIEKIVGNKVIVFNGFKHFNELKDFDIFPEIGEFDEIYIFDKYQKYPGGRFVNSQREWKIYRYKELPKIIKDMLIK